MVKHFCIIIFLSLSITVSAIEHPAFLGIGFSPFEQENIKGLKIDYIIPDSAAASSELKAHDVIYMYDLQTFTSENIGAEFKTYLSTHKSIDETLKLRVLREIKSTSKKIDDDYIDVAHNFDDIQDSVNGLDYNEILEFKFSRMLQHKNIDVVLKHRPFMLTATPSISLENFTKVSYISPFYSSFFSTIKSNYQYENTLSTLKEKQLLNEFWDNGYRLSNVRYLHVNFEKMPAFSSVMKQSVLNSSVQSLYLFHTKLLDQNISLPQDITAPTSDTFDDHITYIHSILERSQTFLTKAFQDLSSEERVRLSSFTPQLLESLTNNFMLDESSALNVGEANELVSISKKVDFDALFTGYSYLLSLQDLKWLENFKRSCKYQKKSTSLLTKTSGYILYEQETDFGIFIIGDSSANSYTSNVSFIIDLGGNDTYKNNAAGHFDTSHINMLIDFNGDDIYSSQESFSQSASFLGYSLLLDVSGDDLYRGNRLTQGTSFFGVSYLIDLEGADSYVAQSFAQGLGLWGIGSLIDYTGNDEFSSTYFSQGVGLTYGIGAVHDYKGDDHYFSGSRHANTYASPGIFKSASQGFGFGLRNIASGGIGILHDKSGDDRYESGNFSLGSGYSYGLGLFLDEKGNDNYLGARYSLGTAAHSALGIFTDFSGNDHYKSLFGSTMGVAWDYSNAYFSDHAGNDTYQCLEGNFVMAQAEHNSFAFFNDKSGKDNYRINFSKPVAENTYDGGKSLSIFLDENGQKDKYSTRYTNNSIDYSNPSFLFLDIEKNLSKFVKNK
ncbi:hypothetical protein DID78_04345 [Candidatus Marinamargulisbacteria bacterium SCGC AG-343-D04]|nr:hypothetical protein DID78_04345 [Candidatus Marinamargulisbacteria bacterium SCGC AG-343-D04]